MRSGINVVPRTDEEGRAFSRLLHESDEITVHMHMKMEGSE
jgi:hypothetical protein